VRLDMRVLSMCTWADNTLSAHAQKLTVVPTYLAASAAACESENQDVECEYFRKL
jgi:hypothetical protein